MLVFPMDVDQPYVAARIDNLNLGRCCSYRRLTSNKIRELSFQIMKDQSIENSIELMKKDMMKYKGNKKVADIILDYLQT